MPNANEFTKEELLAIIDTMDSFPAQATSVDVKFRPVQTEGTIRKTNDGMVFTPRHFNPSTGMGWRD